MEGTTYRLPIIIFVLTLVGVAALYWSGKTAAAARDKHLAAVQQFQQDQIDAERKVVALQREQPTASIGYKEITVPWPKVTSTASSGLKPGHVLANAPEIETVPHQVNVPVAAAANNTAAAQEVNAAGKNLEDSQAVVVAAGAEAPANNQVLGLSREVATLIFSVMIMGASLFVILSKKYPEGTEKWAYASIGTLLGHWLGA